MTATALHSPLAQSWL